MVSSKWAETYKKMREDERRVQEIEREKFFILFNIFCHEIKHENPLLEDACLEIEELMNEAFRDPSFEYKCGLVDGAFIGLG